MNPINFYIAVILLLSCSSNKKMQSTSGLPSCLEAKMKAMTADPSQGSPTSVTSYTYKQQTVYYMVSPCCDKYNVVYDSACNVLGRPDGGFTGRGDGSLSGFKNEATDEKVIWQRK